MSQKQIPKKFLNEHDSLNLTSWNIPKNLLSLHDDPSFVPKPLENPPTTFQTYKSWKAEGLEVEEEQAAEEVEQEEPAEEESVDEEDMLIAEVTTDAGKVSIEKKADSIAASEDNEDPAAAGQEEDGGEELPVKVVFFFLKIQIKLKANTFSGAI